jgi:hypothetical protein
VAFDFDQEFTIWRRPSAGQVAYISAQPEQELYFQTLANTWLVIVPTTIQMAPTMISGL